MARIYTSRRLRGAATIPRPSVARVRGLRKKVRYMRPGGGTRISRSPVARGREKAGRNARSERQQVHSEASAEESEWSSEASTGRQEAYGARAASGEPSPGPGRDLGVHRPFPHPFIGTPATGGRALQKRRRPARVRALRKKVRHMRPGDGTRISRSPVARGREKAGRNARSERQQVHSEASAEESEWSSEASTGRQEAYGARAASGEPAPGPGRILGVHRPFPHPAHWIRPPRGDGRYGREDARHGSGRYGRGAGSRCWRTGGIPRPSISRGGQVIGEV